MAIARSLFARGAVHLVELDPTKHRAAVDPRWGDRGAGRGEAAVSHRGGQRRVRRYPMSDRFTNFC